MMQARAEQRAWEQDNPPPSPPLRRADWQAEHQSLFMRLQDEFPRTHPQQIMDWMIHNLPMQPDHFDSEYITKKEAWDERSFKRLLTSMVLKTVQRATDEDVTVLALVMLDVKTAIDLYWSIMAVSELTFKAVWDEIERVGYTFKGHPFEQVFKARSNGKPLYALNDPSIETAYRLILKHGGGLSDRRLFESLSVPEQVSEFARLFVKEWSEAFAHEDAMPQQSSSQPSHREQHAMA